MKQVISRLLRGGYRFLTRLDWSAVLLFIILLWVALGSWFPQRSPDISADPGRLAFWEAKVNTRYGNLTPLLARLGVFHWYRSKLFKGVLGWLALATLVCTLNRWRGLWRQTFQPLGRVAAAGSHKATVMISDSALSFEKLREILRQYGFHGRLVTDREETYVRGDRNRLTILATLLTHLAVLLLLLGAGLSYIYAWREELTLRPGSAVALEHHRDLAYRNDGLEVLHRPDGSVLNYEAVITILQQGGEVAHGIVRVNAPLVYKGLRAYLRGYVGGEGHYIVTLWVTRDPGYPLIVMGGFLLVVGMTLTFNFPYAWIQGCIVEGALTITGGVRGVARWKAGDDFGRTFAALVKAVRGVVAGASVRRPSANEREEKSSANEEGGMAR